MSAPQTFSVCVGGLQQVLVAVCDAIDEIALMFDAVGVSVIAAWKAGSAKHLNRLCFHV